MSEQFKYDVFLSYANEDFITIKSIAKILRSEGIGVWFDRWEILVGESIPSRIEEGISAARHLVLFISKNSCVSKLVDFQRHIATFRDPAFRERRIIPVLLDSCEPPFALRHLKSINWNDRDSQSELINVCKQTRGHEPSYSADLLLERLSLLSLNILAERVVVPLFASLNYETVRLDQELSTSDQPVVACFGKTRIGEQGADVVILSATIARTDSSSFEYLDTAITEIRNTHIAFPNGATAVPDTVYIIATDRFTSSETRERISAYARLKNPGVTIIDLEKLSALLKSNVPDLVRDLTGNKVEKLRTIHSQIENDKLLRALSMNLSKDLTTVYTDIDFAIGKSTTRLFLANKMEGAVNKEVTLSETGWRRFVSVAQESLETYHLQLTSEQLFSIEKIFEVESAEFHERERQRRTAEEFRTTAKNRVDQLEVEFKSIRDRLLASLKVELAIEKGTGLAAEKGVLAIEKGTAWRGGNVKMG